MRWGTGLWSEAGAGPSLPGPSPWNLCRDVAPHLREHPRSSRDQGVSG